MANVEGPTDVTKDKVTGDTTTTHEAIPLIGEVVSYLLPQYTFYGKISDLLAILLSSSSVNPLLSHTHATRRSLRRRASP